MKLNKREQILAGTVGIAGLLAVAILAWQFLFTGDESFADLEARYKDLSTKVDTKTNTLNNAKRASVKLDEWLRRSLPSDFEVGHTLYHDWLRETVNKAGFRGTKIDAISEQLHRDMFVEFRFTIHAQANFQQLAQFLFDFYRVGHLHKIAILQITPPPPPDTAKDFDLNITVDALALVDAENRNKLSKEPGNRLLRKSFDDYKKVIVDRNIFAPYTDPKPPSKPPVEKPPEKPAPPKFDHLEFTKLTAIIDDGKPQAWIETKTTGESYKVREGEEVTIAGTKVKVLRIGVRDIDLLLGDEKHTIVLGQNLLGKP